MKKKHYLILLGILLIALIVGPYLIPVPPLEKTSPPKALADKDSHFIEVNGLDVHYKIAGKGEPTFLLLHGFGASVFSWEKVIPALATHGTVIAYDRPAFGLTERPLSWDGPNPYGPEAQLDLVIGFMDALGVDQAILVGHSAGGTVAFEAILAYPERFLGLVAVDAAVYAGGGAPAWIRPLLRTPQMRHLGPLIARQIQKRGDDFIRSAWHDPANITPETMAGYRKPLQAENWDKALWELTAASQASDLAERIPEVTSPVLVITGDDDQIVPTKQSLRLAEELPNAHLAVIESCGHLPHEEKPASFLDTVENYLITLEK